MNKTDLLARKYKITGAGVIPIIEINGNMCIVLGREVFKH